ncbi:MAG: hypothetical protein ACXVPU_18210, partial [Bacteroidia bacterium]
MNDQKKRFIVFSLILFLCFSGAFMFLRKKNGAVVQTTEIKKDSVADGSLLKEFFNLETINDASASAEKSFSGKISSKLSPNVEYGFTVSHVLKDLPFYKNLKSVVVSFKSFSEKQDTSASYVFTINDKNGKNIFWNGVAIRSNKKQGWSDDTINFEIKPEFLNPDNTFIFYPWNKQKKTIFIDDISLNYIGSETVSVDPIITNCSLLKEFFDFETINDASASHEKSFSGKMSSKLSPTVEYGFTVKHVLKDLSFYKNLKSVIVSFKCFSEKQDTSASYVFTINDKNGKSIFWNGVAIRSNKKRGWSDDTISFEIKPEFLNPDNTLIFYPWNKQRKTLFIDDVSLNYIGSKTISIDPAMQASNTNFFFDFETLTGLSGTESIKQATAHSGKFAADLTGGKEYGPSVAKKIRDVANEPFKKIALSVWVYPLTDNPNTVLTASVANSKNESVFWEGKGTDNKNFPKNKWTKINASFTLPVEKINLDDILNVGIWNKGKTDVLVDDLEIVYGENAERRGVSATIDPNTIYEKRFVPERNKPPFKTIYFQKQEINNGNSTSINSDKNSVTGDFSPNDNFLAGNFIPDKNNLDEILCLKNSMGDLFAEGLYQYAAEKKQFQKIWENTNPNDSIWNDGNTFYSGDFNADNKTDILAVNKKNKAWRIIDFTGKAWVVVSKGENPKKEWMAKNEIPSSPNAKEIFKPSDIIFPGSFMNETKNNLLKLNTDWRFDLKMVEQDKDGYTILGNADFKGYQNDYNPKYYEFVKIV